MVILLDTQILILAGSKNLPQKAKQYYIDKRYKLLFSPISIYEIVVKSRKGLPNFNVDPVAFYNELLRVGYEELPVTSHHSLMVGSLPMIHKDPFDRILLAQAYSESIQFLTADKELAKYSGSIIYVG